MLATLYKISEVYFRSLSTNGFQVKAKNERFTAASSRCRQNLNMKISRRRLVDYVKKCTRNRAARAARIFFLIQQIKSLICGVVFIFAVVIS